MFCVPTSRGEGGSNLFSNIKRKHYRKHFRLENVKEKAATGHISQILFQILYHHIDLASVPANPERISFSSGSNKQMHNPKSSPHFSIFVCVQNYIPTRQMLLFHGYAGSIANWCNMYVNHSRLGSCTAKNDKVLHLMLWSSHFQSRSKSTKCQL